MASWLVKSYWSAFVLWNLRHERKLPFWPMDRLRATQNRRVRSIVTHAYEHVPFYREAMLKARLRPADFRTALDLEQLPLIHKDQLAHEPERFESRDYRGRNGLTLRSSGTTGLGVSIRTDARALFLALAHGHRSRLAMARFVGRSVGYREAEIVRMASVNSQIRRFLEDHSWTPKGIDLRRLNVDIDAPYAESLAKLNRFQPDVLLGYGSYLGSYFRWLSKQGLDFHRPKMLFYGGDRMPDADRLFIEQELGVPVWSSYQATEALRIAYQCELRQGFHISLDQVDVRVLDREGKRVGPGGTGECVVSNLVNRAMVMLNLRLGDIVTLASGACACGRALPCIERIEGRSDDLLQRPDGPAVSAYGILNRLQEIPGVGQVQLIQQEMLRFHLRVVNSRGLDWSAAGPRIESLLRSVLGQEIQVTAELVDRIPPEPGGKVRATISHCRS